MRVDRLSLRWTLGTITVLVASLAMLVSAVLVALAAVLQETTLHTASSVESVHLAQEAEIDLLLHSRTTDPLTRREFEERILTRLQKTQEHARGPAEERAAREAEAKARAYLAAARDRSTAPEQLVGLLEAAYGALERLVEFNLEAAHDTQVTAQRWNQLGTFAGYGAGAVLFVSAAIALLWLARRAFAPVFDLADAMERFGNGDREARASEGGPTELRRMSRTFNEMASALAQQRRAQLAFLAGVAHDLRNPLSVLKLSAALVPSDAPLPPEPQLRRLIEKLRRQVSHLERMTSDFLDIANIEAGELQLQPKSNDARQIVAHVLELFEDSSVGPRLRASVPNARVELFCDALRIEQVLTNLISNANKYSPADSVIQLDLSVEGDEAVFRVVDQGIGIAEGDRTRIFEPFQRVGLSKENAPGAGLGLFVVRRIVEAHGGTIDLDSRLGAGSTFRVRLPCRADTDRLRQPGHRRVPSARPCC